MNERLFRHTDNLYLKLFLPPLVTILLAMVAYAQDAGELLRQSEIKGGLVVHLGCGNAALTAQLRAGDLPNSSSGSAAPSGRATTTTWPA